MKRRKRFFRKLKYWFSDLLLARKNASANHSARYILDDFNHKEGIERIAELTGLPEGVIKSAFEKIFY